LEKGDAVEDDLVRLAQIPLVRGVRRLLQSEADDAFCLRPDFVRGVRRLARFGFSFDLCVFHRQLANATELVRRCPEVRFVLDHIGKPAIKEGRLEPWRAELKALAALPNIWCKVSGLVTEADWAKWTAADLRPYLEHVRACFGPERLMFGGDWPVSTQATDYPRWVATVDELWCGCPPAELRRLYVANAEQFYQI
jgi:L-fuconolactonase